MESHIVLARKEFIAASVVAAVSLALVGAGSASAQPAQNQAGLPAHQAASTPLTNLSHLNFLLDSVPLKAVDGHTTYKINELPTSQAPWTYCDKKADGSYSRVGGGNLDAATGHWSQGAYNADDIARTAVVYLRHWKLTGNIASRGHAFEMLRELTFLQTTTGPNAGNVVLWQQADGTLAPSAIPVELPDPSDSAESYWVARTLWALGEGYAAFKTTDPAFASFLQERLHLSIGAINRQSLSKYDTYDIADGVKVPAWLISGGADASAEAVFGLAAYSQAAPKDTLASDALRKLSRGISEMSSGNVQQWPFGAIMPWNQSQTLWHAWGGMAAAALATASPVLKQPSLLTAAVKDSAQFTPQLLAVGGPDNAWSPTPGEAQIAYGVDSRLQGLVATAKAAAAPGLLDVAAITAGWFFGANKSGLPAYNPANGTAIDGIETDGRVNPNSGAESTIHALLSMLTLDANPTLKAKALGITKKVSTHGLSVVEAESGTLTGGSVVKPASAWTGEANISGGAYVALNSGGTLTLEVPGAEQARNIYPIINQGIAVAGKTTWNSGRTKLGTTDNGGAGAQGITDAPGILFPFALKKELPAGAKTVVASSNGAVSIDALLIQPQISTVSVTGTGGDSTLYISAASGTVEQKVNVPKGFKLQQKAFDAKGRQVSLGHGKSGKDLSGSVRVAPGGFTTTTLVRK